jgi:hypothetical protein
MADKQENKSQNSDKNIKQDYPQKGFSVTLPSIRQEMILPGVIKQRHLVSSPTQVGDMYYGNGNSFLNLPAGIAGQVLTISGGVPVWSYLLTTGLAASRPTAGSFAGQQFFSIDTFVLSIWTGAAWKTTTLS